MIQQGVSDSETEGGSGMPTIERVLDWVEARYEAVRARAEEEEEDEERDRERSRSATADPAVKQPMPRASSAPVVQQRKDNVSHSSSMFLRTINSN